MLRSEEAVLGAWGFRGAAPCPKGEGSAAREMHVGLQAGTGTHHGQQGRATVPHALTQACHGTFQTSQRWRRQGHAASSLCPRPRGHHGSGGLASSPSPWPQHFRADPTRHCCLTSPCFRLHSKKKSCPAILSLVLAERPRQPSPPPTRACPTRAASRGPRASMGAGDPDGQLDGWPCSLEGRSCRAPAQLGGALTWGRRPEVCCVLWLWAWFLRGGGW